MLFVYNHREVYPVSKLAKFLSLVGKERATATTYSPLDGLLMWV